MTKHSDTASRAGGMTEKQVKRERAAINRDLDDIEIRWPVAPTAQEEKAEMNAALCRVRQRIIAFARSQGAAEFARMMQPFDDDVGGNVVRFRRRVR